MSLNFSEASEIKVNNFWQAKKKKGDATSKYFCTSCKIIYHWMCNLNLGHFKVKIPK